jgi:single-strand DNA-binding protein
MTETVRQAKNEQTERADRKTEKRGEVHKEGNLTRDWELRFSNSGVAFARNAVATERPKVAGDWKGELVKEFFELVAFGDLAQHVSISLVKGDRVLCIGEGEIETWTDSQGRERTTKKILLRALGPDLKFRTVTLERAKRQAVTDEDSIQVSEEPF